MKIAETPWSHIFFGLGLILIMRSYYDMQIGTYSTSNDHSVFIDTLKEKIRFTKGGRGVSDKYHIQLSYDKSDFVIADNGSSIIKRNESKEKLITSLSPGDLITVLYESSNKELIDDSRNTIKIIGLKSSGFQILNPDEIRAADRTDIRNWNLAGIGLIVLGGISYFIKKRKKQPL